MVPKVVDTGFLYTTITPDFFGASVKTDGPYRLEGGNDYTALVSIATAQQLILATFCGFVIGLFVRALRRNA